MNNQSLYHTEVENQDGIHGMVHVVKGGDLAVKVANPVHDDPGSNPEQLLGMALATCLNATIEAEEKRRHLPHQSSVRVGVDLHFDQPGFQFFLDAQVKIPEVDRQTGEAILKKCEGRCPVAKLLQGNENVKVHLVDQFDFGGSQTK